MVTFSFCAEKMAFMIGMYDDDKSGETERMRMRGSGTLVEPSATLVEMEGSVMRLM